MKSYSFAVLSCLCILTVLLPNKSHVYHPGRVAKDIQNTPRQVASCSVDGHSAFFLIISFILLLFVN